MNNEKPPGGLVPMPPVDAYMRAYRQLDQNDEQDEPIEETVDVFARTRLNWPVDVAIRVTQRCHDVALIETSAGMGERITADTLIEGRYRR